MLEIGINPVIFRFGLFSMEWHGVISAFGVLLGVVVAWKYMARAGFSNSVIYGLAWWAVIGGIAGARFFHVMDYPEYYFSHPLQILLITQGGLAIYGAIFGGFVGAVLYVWKNKLPMGKLFDAGAPAMILGLAIGRIGCFVNGDSWGAPTGAGWGVIYTHPGARLPASLLGVPTHPFPIYELILDLAIFFGFTWARSRGLIKTNGVTVLLVLVSYAVGRFFLTFFRQEREFIFGLQQAQLVAIACLVTMVPAIIYLVVRQRQKKAAGLQTEELPAS